MPLMPKRTKHRKMQKGRMRGKATRGNCNRSFSYRKSNRSSQNCYDSLYKKRWKSVDKNIPR